MTTAPLSIELADLLSHRAAGLTPGRRRIVVAVASEVMATWDSWEAVEATASLGASEEDIKVAQDIILLHDLVDGDDPQDLVSALEDLLADVADHIERVCRGRVAAERRGGE